MRLLLPALRRLRVVTQARPTSPDVDWHEALEFEPECGPFQVRALTDRTIVYTVSDIPTGRLYYYLTAAKRRAGFASRLSVLEFEVYLRKLGKKRK